MYIRSLGGPEQVLQNDAGEGRVQISAFPGETRFGSNFESKTLFEKRKGVERTPAPLGAFTGAL